MAPARLGLCRLGSDVRLTRSLVAAGRCPWSRAIVRRSCVCHLAIVLFRKRKRNRLTHWRFVWAPLSESHRLLPAARIHTYAYLPPQPEVKPDTMSVSTVTSGLSKMALVAVTVTATAMARAMMTTTRDANQQWRTKMTMNTRLQRTPRIPTDHLPLLLSPYRASRDTSTFHPTRYSSLPFLLLPHAYRQDTGTEAVPRAARSSSRSSQSAMLLPISRATAKHNTRTTLSVFTTAKR